MWTIHPDRVEKYEKLGTPSSYLNFAFNPRMFPEKKKDEKETFDISFIGSTHLHIRTYRYDSLQHLLYDLEQDFHTNLYGGYVLLQCTHTHCPNLKRFVYASTTSIYSDALDLPTSENYYKIRLPYAASKFSVEHYCDVYYHMYQLPVSVLRLSNVFGPGQSPSNPYCGVIAKFFEAVKKKKPLIIYGDGQQTRDFTFIEDALQAFLLAAVKEKAIGQVYNVGTGIETTVIKLANEIKRITGFTEGFIQFRPKRPVDIVERRNIDAKKIQKRSFMTKTLPIFFPVLQAKPLFLQDLPFCPCLSCLTRATAIEKCRGQPCSMTGSSMPWA